MDREIIKNFIIKVRKMLKFLSQLTRGPKVYAIAPATSNLPALPPKEKSDVDIHSPRESVVEPPINIGSIGSESSVEDSVAVVELSKKRRKRAKPKDDSDNNANNDSSKEEEDMTEHKGKSHHHRKYLCIEPLQVPRVHTSFEFNTCCCNDEVEEIIQAFYEFVIAKKALFPALIKKVRLVKSPNDGCALVTLSWLINIEGFDLPQAAEDLIEEIFEKYLEYLDSL